MKKDVYFTETPSVYNLMIFLKDRNFPVRTTGDFPTMRVFYESVLPKELFRCMHYKTAEKNEKNANATWLHRGDPTANGRRKEMADVLRGASAGEKDAVPLAKAVPEMRKRFALLLTRETDIPDERVLSDILLKEEDCVPFPEEDALRATYLRYMRYFISKDVPYALMTAVLMLLLGKYAGDVLRPLIKDEGAGEQDVSTSSAALLYDNGDFAGALRMLTEMEKQGGLSDADRVHALYLSGEIRRTGAAGKADATQAYRDYESAYRLSGKTNADACYRLFQMAYRGEGLKTRMCDEACAFLKEACALGHREALLDMASFLASGERDLKIKKDTGKARELYRKGAAAGDAAFLLGLGQLEEDAGRAQEAEEAWFHVSRAGSREAAYRLDRLRQTRLRGAQGVRKAGKKTGGKTAAHLPQKVILTNTDNRTGKAFLESAASYLAGEKEQWTHLRMDDGGPEALCSMIAADAEMAPDAYAEWIFLLFDENEAKNLTDARRIIALLNAVADNPSWRDWLAESVYIFFRSTTPESLAALQTDRLNALYDSAKENGEPVPCYRIRSCNEIRDASLYLLSHLPPFLGDYGTRHADGADVVLWGDGEITERLVRDIYAVYPFRNLYREKVRIAVVAPDAEEIRMRLASCAPALFEREAKDARRADIRFFAEEDEAVLQLADKMSSEGGDPLQTLFAQSGYFVLCGADGERNAEKGILLREKLTRNTLSGRNMPFIAVYVGERALSEALSDAGTQGALHQAWHSHYHLHPFGAPEILYTYRNLCRNRLEERALKMHLSYYGAKSEDIRQALGDYRSRYYNRDSSVMSALGTIYAAAVAGVRLKDVYGYGTDAEKELAVRYGEWLEKPGNRDLAAMQEHERWRYLLYTRGWRQASLAQAERYIRAGNPSHQLHIAKLHPYLCAWDELDRLGERFNEMMRTLYPGYKDRDIKAADYNMVEKGARLLLETD